MNKTKLMVIGLVSIVLMMNGCATIVSGQTQVVDVTSSNAKKFKIDGKEYTTPARVTLDRGNDAKTIEVDDCQDLRLNTQLNPAFLGNLLIGGIPGSITDIASGASWKYDDSLHINCK